MATRERGYHALLSIRTRRTHFESRILGTPDHSETGGSLHSLSLLAAHSMRQKQPGAAFFTRTRSRAYLAWLTTPDVFKPRLTIRLCEAGVIPAEGLFVLLEIKTPVGLFEGRYGC